MAADEIRALFIAVDAADQAMRTRTAALHTAQAAVRAAHDELTAAAERHRQAKQELLDANGGDLARTAPPPAYQAIGPRKLRGA